MQKKDSNRGPDTSQNHKEWQGQPRKSCDSQHHYQDWPAADLAGKASKECRYKLGKRMMMPAHVLCAQE